MKSFAILECKIFEKKCCRFLFDLLSGPSISLNSRSPLTFIPISSAAFSMFFFRAQKGSMSSSLTSCVAELFVGVQRLRSQGEHPHNSLRSRDCTYKLIKVDDKMVSNE